MSFTLYGIPNCGTVKKARAWLEERGVEHDFVDYRENPVGKDRIARWAEALGAKSLRNTSGGAYRAMDKKTRDAYSDDDWVQAFSKEPMLIKRPVIERDGTPVKVGFRGEDATIADQLGLDT